MSDAQCRRLEGKVAVVTGGAGGIGVATVERLAAEGAKVAVVDFTEDGVRKAVASLQDAGWPVEGFSTDVGDPASVERTFRAICDTWGRIDVLVCGAGVRPLGLLDETSLEDWDLSIRVNLTGVFLCGRAAAGHMRAHGGGSIVVIASVNGIRGVATMGAYNAAKAGTIGLINTMAIEWAEDGIRTNAIAPAQVETPMIAEQVGDLRRRREDRIPLGRYGRPKEIAAAAAFLASDDAAFVNGHVLAVDGGYLSFGFKP